MLVNRIEEISQDGAFAFNRNHDLDGVLQKAIDAFEGVAFRFSVDFIHDAKERAAYQGGIKRLSSELMEEVKSGKLTVKEGAEFCNEMRNKIVAESRLASTPVGRSYAQSLKPDGGIPIQDLLKKYSHDLFKRSFSDLTEVEKSKVYYTIIESAGRDRAKVTAGTRRLRVIGKVCLLITATMAAYNITTAENKQKETIRQGAIIAGGAGGGFLAGLTVSAICGPGAWVCAVAIVLVGSIAGSAAVGAIVDAYDEELEEFTKWQIR